MPPPGGCASVELVNATPQPPPKWANPLLKQRLLSFGRKLSHNFTPKQNCSFVSQQSDGSDCYLWLGDGEGNTWLSLSPSPPPSSSSSSSTFQWCWSSWSRWLWVSGCLECKVVLISSPSSPLPQSWGKLFAKVGNRRNRRKSGKSMSRKRMRKKRKRNTHGKKNKTQGKRKKVGCGNPKEKREGSISRNGKRRIDLKDVGKSWCAEAATEAGFQLLRKGIGEAALARLWSNYQRCHQDLVQFDGETPFKCWGKASLVRGINPQCSAISHQIRAATYCRGQKYWSDSKSIPSTAT